MQTKGEQQFDEAFFIRDKGAAVNHGENFLQRCPSYGAYLFRLELELFRMDIHGVNVYVTKALFPVDGQDRSGISKIDLQAEFLPCFPLSSIPAVFPADCTAGCA